MTPEKRCVTDGDLNGHTKLDNDEVRRVHKDKSMRVRNQKGKSLLDFAVTFDKAILTRFSSKAAIGNTEVVPESFNSTSSCIKETKSERWKTVKPYKK